mgnify:CR=1 FL=1
MSLTIFKKDSQFISFLLKISIILYDICRRQIHKFKFILLDNTKLIKLLKTFTPSEFSEFGKFLNSPFHNESPKMQKLFRYFKKYFPDFKGAGFTPEKAFSGIYGNVKYENKKLRERLSDMLSLAENYLAIVNLKNDSVKYKMLTLNEFAKRDLPVHFDKKHRELLAILNGEVFKNENSFYDEYILHSKKLNFTSLLT